MQFVSGKKTRSIPRKRSVHFKCSTMKRRQSEKIKYWQILEKCWQISWACFRRRRGQALRCPQRHSPSVTPARLCGCAHPLNGPSDEEKGAHNHEHHNYLEMYLGKGRRQIR